jgi:hypothetical protein
VAIKQRIERIERIERREKREENVFVFSFSLLLTDF